MPSPLALAHAHTLKTSAAPRAPAEGRVQPAETWFLPHSTHVSYESLAAHADAEYAAWRTVDPRIVHEHTLRASLEKYVAEATVEGLAEVLDRVPAGLAAHPDTGVAFDFLPWQRLSMAHWHAHLFDVTSRVAACTATLREMTAPPHRDRMRTLPITAQCSVLRGSCPDHFVCDLPTAGGKTAWALGAATSLLVGTAYAALQREYHHKRSGACVAGPPEVRFARLVLVACAGNTFQHFVETARRLVPRLEAMEQGRVHVQVWDHMGKQYTTATAHAAPPHHLIVWVVPVKRLNEALRADPTVTVPVVVTDEFTVAPPRERWNTEHSHVCKQLITQATPQALVGATRGTGRTWLRDALGGTLFPPRALRRLVEDHEWKDATLCAAQVVRLDLMTLTPFRAFVREELRALVPPGVDLLFVRSRRVTAAAYLARATTDLIPMDLYRVLLGQLAAFEPDDASRDRLRATLHGRATTPDELATVLSGVASRRTGHVDRTGVDRLCARLREFAQECPICKEENLTSVNLFGCCGYCVCDVCYGTCGSACPFCRSAVRARLPRSVVRYPAAPAPVFTPEALRGNDMVVNVTFALHHLRMQGCTRVLIVVERSRYAVLDDLTVHLDTTALSFATGVAVDCVDHLLGGRATEFARIKRVFDGAAPEPRALMCFGVADTFLVGTDLTSVDGVLVAGAIDGRILTQAMARFMRPNPRRDNTRPILQITVRT